jgi:hypothetical protein
VADVTFNLCPVIPEFYFHAGLFADTPPLHFSFRLVTLYVGSSESGNQQQSQPYCNQVFRDGDRNIRNV